MHSTDDADPVLFVLSNPVDSQAPPEDMRDDEELDGLFPQETFSSQAEEFPAAAEDRQADEPGSLQLLLNTAAKAYQAAEAEMGADADAAAGATKGVASAESIIENLPSASNSIAALTKLNQSLSEELKELKAKDAAHTAEIESLSLARLKENQSMHTKLREKDTAHAAHMVELAETTAAKADDNQPEAQTQRQRSDSWAPSTAPVKHQRLEMRVRVASAKQFANEVKWELLAHQLRNEHVLTCFNLEKWMNSGLR